ncbi:MAG: hypothetical protein ACMG6H_03785 [Acidobacteriota bacterium]
MFTFRLTFLKFLSLIGFALSSFYGVSAQSTVFNVPSTDVQTTQRWYVEADFTAHLSSYKTGGYQAYGPRIIYGLNKRMEVGINAFYTRTSPVEPIEIQPNFKVQLYKNEDKGFALAAGTVVFIPLTQRSSSTTRATVYAVASKNVKGDFGPRFTVGSYALVGSFEKGTSKQGVLIGYEQPITKRLSFVADWSSGNNDYGYVVAGAGLILSPKSVLYVGYNIGNSGRGNNSLGVYYGFSF